MKYLFIVLFSLSSFGLAAQNDMAYVQELTKDFTQKLKDRGISDYVVHQHLCPGRIEMFKIGDEMCITKDNYVEAYILWKEDEQVFLKKLDNCGLYYSIPLEEETTYTYYLDHRNEMEQERVQKYRTGTYIGKPAISRKARPCGRTFDFNREGESIRKGFSLYDLANDSEEGANVNYESNMKLKLVEFNTLLGAEIEKHTFKRQ